MVTKKASDLAAEQHDQKVDPKHRWEDWPDWKILAKRLGKVAPPSQRFEYLGWPSGSLESSEHLARKHNGDSLFGMSTKKQHPATWTKRAWWTDRTDIEAASTLKRVNQIMNRVCPQCICSTPADSNGSLLAKWDTVYHEWGVGFLVVLRRVLRFPVELDSHHCSISILSLGPHMPRKHWQTKSWNTSNTVFGSIWSHLRVFGPLRVTKLFWGTSRTQLQRIQHTVLTSANNVLSHFSEDPMLYPQLSTSKFTKDWHGFSEKWHILRLVNRSNAPVADHEPWGQCQPAGGEKSEKQDDN